MDTLGSRIRKARKEKGLKQSDIAQHFGIARTNLSAWENDDNGPDRSKLEPLARLLGVDVSWLISGDGPEPVNLEYKRPNAESETTPGVTTANLPRVAAIPGSDLVSPTADLPVFAAARGGDGHVIVTFDAIDWVKRPEPLRNVKGGYGLLITGDSMYPAYRSGDIALINPHLPPMRDTEVVLYHTPPDDSAEAIIKTLVGFNDREWTLRQYNPDTTFTEFVKEWPICHRCVGKYASR
ncbi:XRE family transcriptional regulator [Aureimonas sp. AU40]|uniref:XRE family transcriptional regulator n=1 Tax=Aureimonas sp. AU40 TaxID=1637747 RepID=UPI001FCDAF93|nr:helix-turn-helix domain-containing protein [Aureimonas sp. AU40]